MQMNAPAQHVHPGCNLAVAGIASDQMLFVDRYQEAVRMHPGCPAEVRLGLAACYFRLGQLERAKRAYERVVQLSPSCAEALYGLAVLRFSSSQGESAKAVSRVMQDLETVSCSAAEHGGTLPSLVFKKLHQSFLHSTYIAPPLNYHCP